MNEGYGWIDKDDACSKQELTESYIICREPYSFRHCRYSVLSGEHTAMKFHVSNAKNIYSFCYKQQKQRLPNFQVTLNKYGTSHNMTV
jgi:hypothetical protein